MTKSEIYLRAAELIDTNPDSYIERALPWVEGVDFDQVFMAGHEVFYRHDQVLALCFAAAMAETGDL